MSLKKLATLSLLLVLGACASSKAPPRPLDLPFSRIFPAAYDTVYDATLNVIDVYVVVSGDRESGEIRTEALPARFNSSLYEHPKVDSNILEDVQYSLKIQLSKGVIAQTGGPATRVQILKEYSAYKNFYADWNRKPTDGIEENVLLYRIGQRIKILEALKRKKPGANKGPSPTKSSEKPAPKPHK